MESNVPGIRPELQSSVPGVRLRLSPEAEILFSRATKHALTFVPITFLHEYENLTNSDTNDHDFIAHNCKRFSVLYNNYNMCILLKSSQINTSFIF